jgi:hypothetical protein
MGCEIMKTLAQSYPAAGARSIFVAGTSDTMMPASVTILFNETGAGELLRYGPDTAEPEFGLSGVRIPWMNQRGRFPS